jgi:regulator of cell morphogenesis and NO signaling
MDISKQSIIGTIVAHDYRMAGIFEREGIDFCCSGNRTIEAACTDLHLSPDLLITELQQAIQDTAKDGATDYNSWPIALLADYIEQKHHRYVTAQIPVIKSMLEKIVRVHGGRHPELAEIAAHFDACASELAVHMKKEELMLFPFIRKMVRARQAGHDEVASPFGTVKNPIAMMMHEHDAEGDRIRKIKQLSNDYTAPADGCNTYKAAFATLKAFEDDLHLHIHLENNILFPKAVELEQSFAA